MIETVDWSGFEPESTEFQSVILPDCTTSPLITYKTFDNIKLTLLVVLITKNYGTNDIHY